MQAEVERLTKLEADFKAQIAAEKEEKEKLAAA